MAPARTTTQTMQAAVTDACRRLERTEVKLPEIPPEGALIEVLGCGVCGSDVDKLLHRNIAAGTVLGHEVVGRIIKSIPFDPSPALRAPSPKGEGIRRVALAHHVPCETCHYCRHGS